MPLDSLESRHDDLPRDPALAQAFQHAVAPHEHNDLLEHSHCEAEDAAQGHPQFGGAEHMVDHPSVAHFPTVDALCASLEGWADRDYIAYVREHEGAHFARAEEADFAPEAAVMVIDYPDGRRGFQPFTHFTAAPREGENILEFREKLLEIARAPQAPSDGDQRAIHAHEQAIERDRERLREAA